MSEYRSINTKTNQNCKYQKSSSICLFLIDFPSCASSLISLSLSNVTLSQQSWSSSTQDIIYPNIKNWKPSSTHPCTLENHWLRSWNTLLQPYLHRTHHRGPGMHSASFLQTPLTVYSWNIETTPYGIFNTFPVIWNNGGLDIRTYWGHTGICLKEWSARDPLGRSVHAWAGRTIEAYSRYCKIITVRLFVCFCD